MTQEPKSKQATLRVLVTPLEANATGELFGGWLLAQVDLAGSIIARRRAKGRVVTVAVNAFQFLKPVLVGDVVSFYAELQEVGTTSVTISVQVFSERDVAVDSKTVDVKTSKVADAIFVYVAVDAEGQPRPLE